MNIGERLLAAAGRPSVPPRPMRLQTTSMGAPVPAALCGLAMPNEGWLPGPVAHGALRKRQLAALSANAVTFLSWVERSEEEYKGEPASRLWSRPL
jgi:hypothetical protein